MPSTVQEDKEEAEPNVAVTMASVTELVESGLTPYMAGKLVASRNMFIASEVEGGAAEGEVWRRLKSWDEFWEAMDDTGLRGIGPAKQLKLRTTGVYFGNRNLNAMDDKELEELLGDDAEAVSAVLGDPEEAEGAESIAELLEKLPETTRKDKVVQRLVQAALYVSPRQLSNLNDAALWTSDALDAVPGIGPKTVAKIVAARAERPRGFATWEEVPVTRGKLRALIRAGLTVEQAGSKDEVRIHENQAIIAKKVEQKLSEEAGAKGDGPTTTSGGTAAAEEKEDGHGAAGEDGQLLELSPEISNGKTSTGSGPTGAEEGGAEVVEDGGDKEGAKSRKGRQRLMDDVWAPGKGSAGSGSCGTKHPVCCLIVPADSPQYVTLWLYASWCTSVELRTLDVSTSQCASLSVIRDLSNACTCRLISRRRRRKQWEKQRRSGSIGGSYRGRRICPSRCILWTVRRARAVSARAAAVPVSVAATLTEC
jgi:hypothetical protein